MPLTRRAFLKQMALSISALVLARRVAFPDERADGLISKAIPTSGEKIPVIGMGTWITFNVGNSAALRDDRTEVLKAFFANGGGLVDSSPMYGSSEEVLGYALQKLGYPEGLFAATKVWTPSPAEGIEQIARSQDLWGLKTIDLFQVHNLVSWREHLKTLYAKKEKGQIRYVGITTSHGRRHDEFASIMRNEPLDFVQLTYNVTHREVESRLLNIARDKGIAVIANRPFDGGSLIDGVKRHPLPSWAEEAHCRTWAEFLLKFIVSHPAVTCAIPATSQVGHMRENMGACVGELPDDAMRQRMARFVENL